MGRASRRKHEQRKRRTQLGLEGLDLPAPLRRQLIRELSQAPTIEEFRAELAQFTRVSVIEAAAASATAVPPVLIGRLIREVAAVDPSGRRTMHTAKFRTLAARLQNVADPAAWAMIGTGRLHDVMLTRAIADSVPFHSRPHLAVHRALAVLLDPGGPSLLDAKQWKQRLGVSLKNLFVGAMFLHDRGPGTFNVGSLRGDATTTDVATVVGGTLGVLSTRLDQLRHPGTGTPNDLYDLGPLASTPAIWIDDAHISIPSPKHIWLAVSLPALYIRLIREDAAEHTRTRSTLVGKRFESYLLRYARAGLPGDRWEVRSLDEEPQPGGKIADIAIWPVDRSFIVVLEAKASLSLMQAMLGNTDRRDDTRRLYQKSFNQIDNTVASVGKNGFLADAPSGVPVFGYTVTIDLHLTSVVDDTTYFGLVLGYRPPGDPGALSQAASCRVVSADNAEELLDLLATITATEALDVLHHITDQPTPLTAIPAAIDEFGYQDRLAASPLNHEVEETLAGLCNDLTDPVFRAWPLTALTPHG